MGCLRTWNMVSGSPCSCAVSRGISGTMMEVKRVLGPRARLARCSCVSCSKGPRAANVYEPQICTLRQNIQGRKKGSRMAGLVEGESGAWD